MLTQAAILGARRSFEVSSNHILVGFISGLAVIVCVLIQYETILWTVRLLPRVGVPRRARIAVLILALMVAHVVEVWIFGILYWFLEAWPALGTIAGLFHEGALDFIYFSVVTFSTLGYGDFLPTGPITILCGTEALVGLTFIAWTASVAFLEMQHDWVEFRRHGPKRD